MPCLTFVMLGITPAHAGKTVRISNPYGAMKDHPRACGENLHLRCREKRGNGSPPRMRGKLALLEPQPDAYTHLTLPTT